MPIPSNPTLEQLVREGLAKAGESSPDADMLVRAEGTWIEEIKNDIWEKGKKPKLLHITSYGVLQRGQSRYANPTDFSSDLSLTSLDGSVTGTAQSGSVSSITLAANDVSEDSSLAGKGIIIVSGTAQGSYSQITSFDPSTKQAIVVPNFNTAPALGSVYLIVDTELPITVDPIFVPDSMPKTAILGRPDRFAPVGDEDNGEFVLNKAPDKVYGVRMRYYANIMKVDTDSTLMSTIYQRFRNIFIEGIRFKKIDDEDDDRADGAESRYERKMGPIIYREIYGMDISNINDRVTDYQ